MLGDYRYSDWRSSESGPGEGAFRFQVFDSNLTLYHNRGDESNEFNDNIMKLRTSGNTDRLFHIVISTVILV